MAVWFQVLEFFPGRDFESAAHTISSHPTMPPTLHSIEPDTGYVLGGDIVTVKGTHFTRSTRCFFGVVVAAETVFVADTELVPHIHATAMQTCMYTRTHACTNALARVHALILECMHAFAHTHTWM